MIRFCAYAYLWYLAYEQIGWNILWIVLVFALFVWEEDK